MFKVYHSNRLEQLAAHLVAHMQVDPLQSPFDSEVIVCQHQGMARWLSMQLAQVQGIAANIDYPFPASYIWTLYRSQLPEVPLASDYDRSILSWRVMKALPQHLDNPLFAPLKHYLSEGRDQLKQYQLSRYIADTFEQYLIYRPDWILDWEKGRDTGCEKHPWQAALWRAISKEDQSLHRARVHQQFMAKVGALDGSTLPERIMVFGVSSLPPAYLDVLAAIAQHIDVHLFVLNPCLAFWEEITDPRTLARLRQLWQRQGKPDVSDYYEIGNSLLASMGKQGKEFQGLLHHEAYGIEDEDCAVFPEESTLLESVQSDILQLLERGQGDYQATKLAEDDRSIQIHSCHSPMREVQVLYDQLLALFEATPELLPRDVIVMTPEIDTYAPYIEAVFSTASEGRRIPWSIADRSHQAEHPLLNTFLQMLQLPNARMQASEVLVMLEVPAIARYYQLDEQALLRIRQWVQESGIRWGWDAESRSELDQPADDSFSWRFGLERLMLGYAMPADEQAYAGRVPYPHIEGMEAQWLGRLNHFLDDLVQLRQRLSQSHRPARWQLIINEILERFEIEEDDEQQAMQLLRDVLDGLRQHTEQAEFEQLIPLEVVQDYLKGHLISPAKSHRFLAGQVSFCAMMPMRSLPFKVVCMIGMNDSSYPRTRPPLGFDLMVDKPRPGDRSRRDDDRYLFLEALLSARQQLYISYVGRSIRDNAMLLPSVLVSELLDYVEQGFVAANSESAFAQLITEHPLQPFSPRYFLQQNGLFSYANEWLPASQALTQGEEIEQPFISDALSKPDEAHRSISLSELIRFFNAPVRYFMQQRLGIVLNREEDVLEDSEPFSLDSLEVYQLKQQLVQQAVNGADLDEYYQLLQGRGELPVGAFGRADYDSYCDDAQAFAEQLSSTLQQVVDPVEIDLQLGDFYLHGWLHEVTDYGLQRYRYTKTKAKDRLALWLSHLALCAMAPDNIPHRSQHIGEDGVIEFAPVADAKTQLLALLELYWQGLNQPLQLYPETSLVYVQFLEKEGRAVALDKAIKTFEGNDFYAGEWGDEYLQLAMRGVHPLSEQFAQLAEQLFAPMLAAEQQL